MNFVVNICDLTEESCGGSLLDCASILKDTHELYAFARLQYDRFVSSLFSWYLDSHVGLLRSRDKIDLIYIGVVCRQDYREFSLTYSIIFTVAGLSLSSFLCELKDFQNDVPMSAICNGNGFNLSLLSNGHRTSPYVGLY